MDICKECGNPLDQFRHGRLCRVCKNAYGRTHYQLPENKKRRAELNKKWHEKNRARHKELTDRWVKDHPAETYAAQKRWREKNPEKWDAVHQRSYAKNKDKWAERQRNWRKENPDAAHDIYLKSTYGVPKGTYARLLAEQGDGCAICGSTTPQRKGATHLYLDHCHKTGTIRGLLCYPHNTALGHLNDDPEQIRRLITYLLKYT